MNNTKGVEDGMGALLDRARLLIQRAQQCETFKSDIWHKYESFLVDSLLMEREPAPATLPVPERTAEMEELMGRLRAAAEKATPGKWSREWFYSVFRYLRKQCGWWDDYEMLAPDGVFAKDEDCDADYIAAASPENILKLLDHIEGKG